MSNEQQAQILALGGIAAALLLLRSSDEDDDGSGVVQTPPTADFTADVDSNGVLSVDAGASTPGDAADEITTYEWEVEHPDGRFSLSSGISATFNLSLEGDHAITLTVTNDQNLQDSESTSVTYDQPDPEAPTADFIADMNDDTGELSVDGSASTPGANANSIDSYEWAISHPDGASTQVTGVSNTIQLDVEDTHEIELTVTNDFGLSDSATTTVEYQLPNPDAPLAAFSMDTSGGTVTLDASASQPRRG